MKRAFVARMEGGGHEFSIRERPAPDRASGQEQPDDAARPPEAHWSLGQRVLLPGGGVGVVQRVDGSIAYAVTSEEAREVPIPKHLVRPVVS